MVKYFQVFRFFLDFFFFAYWKTTTEGSVESVMCSDSFSSAVEMLRVFGFTEDLFKHKK